ncbi:MAG TPA: MarR family transcriptional regulator [Intrasporangium sp.]|uniref:MarR family winged helix-turn-helix transcriptional regulator n=1 Tax=Intrasporangium sp. TaxID=1925024 RepID=UPI002D76A270|nr:MarR family transcriptional regulator [Intrasporangium sp.]HET7398298.1 MarR family transcriptional regulator [Intrasporangium sp.]
MSVSRESANELFLSLIRVQKLLLAARHHAPRVHAGVDTAAYPVLFVVAGGPARVSDIASTIHSDVSTVSRHVSGLVRHGLLAKAADPSDGRAQVVSLTAEGIEVVREIQHRRAGWFQQLLEGWEGADCDELSERLHALSDVLDTSLRTRGATPPPPPTDLTLTDSVPSQEHRA